MDDFKQCEECGIKKPDILFAKFSLTCKMCMHQIGMKNAVQRRKRKEESSLDIKLCRVFIRNQIFKPTGWEMTLL